MPISEPSSLGATPRGFTGRKLNRGLYPCSLPQLQQIMESAGMREFQRQNLGLDAAAKKRR